MCLTRHSLVVYTEREREREREKQSSWMITCSTKQRSSNCFCYILYVLESGWFCCRFGVGISINVSFAASRRRRELAGDLLERLVLRFRHEEVEKEQREQQKHDEYDERVLLQPLLYIAQQTDDILRIVIIKQAKQLVMQSTSHLSVQNWDSTNIPNGPSLCSSYHFR